VFRVYFCKELTTKKSYGVDEFKVAIFSCDIVLIIFLFLGKSSCILLLLDLAFLGKLSFLLL